MSPDPDAAHARRAGRFAAWLDDKPDSAMVTALRAAETIGRPLGSPAFLDHVAARTGRDPRPDKRGPKKCASGSAAAADGIH